MTGNSVIFHNGIRGYLLKSIKEGSDSIYMGISLAVELLISRMIFLNMQ